MQRLWVRAVVWAAVSAVMPGVVAAAAAQTDIAASLYGSFGGSTSGNGTAQSPSNGPGGLIELRHIANPLAGFELTYSFNRANQQYTPSVGPCSGTGCVVAGAKAVAADAHEVTADYVVSLHLLIVRPFVLAGGGVILNVPTSGQTGTQNSTEAVFVYGAGTDIAVLPHLGVRLQYRGNVYKAPQLATAFSSTGAFMKTAQPMGGVYLRF